MVRLLRLAVLVPSLFAVLPVLAADKADEDPKVRSKLLQAEYLEGKLTQIDGDGDDKSFTVVVTAKTTVHNQANEAKATELYKKVLTMSAGLGKKPNAQQIQNLNKAKADYQEARSKIDEVKDVDYEFSLKSGKDLHVRRYKMPPKDGGGRYSDDELKKAKGDNPKLPGYTAEVKDLDKESTVRVWLDRKSIKPVKKDEDAPTYTAITMMLMPTDDKPKKK